MNLCKNRLSVGKIHIFILKLLLNLRIIAECRIGERTMSFTRAETISKGSGLPGSVAFPSCAAVQERWWRTLSVLAGGLE